MTPLRSSSMGHDEPARSAAAEQRTMVHDAGTGEVPGAAAEPQAGPDACPTVTVLVRASGTGVGV